MHHTTRIQSLMAAFAVLVASAGLAACDVMVNTMHGGRSQAERTWTHTYTLAGPDARVEIANINGAIEIEAVDGTVLDVKARVTARGSTDEDAQKALAQVQISEEASPASVRLEAKYPRELGRHGVEVTYTIRAPRTARLSLENVNGRVTVAGAFAGVKAETTNGSVQGKGLGSNVVATTTNGEIKIQMASVAGDGVSLETTNGSIDLRLPGDAKATVAARCVNGGIAVSDLPFEKSGEGSRRKLDGTINGGGAAVKLETVNGRIRVGRVS
jgi:hypothetical protein